jgi:cytochrome b561
MSKEGSPQVAPVEDALAGVPEPWERWETSLVLISLGIGLFGLLLLGWLVDRFILS